MKITNAERRGVMVLALALTLILILMLIFERCDSRRTHAPLPLPAEESVEAKSTPHVSDSVISQRKAARHRAKKKHSPRMRREYPDRPSPHDTPTPR